MKKIVIAMTGLMAALTLSACTQSGSTEAAAPPVAPATSEARTMTADQIAERLKTAGAPLTVTKVYTAADDPNHQLGRPGGYTSKIAFGDARVKRSEVQDTDPLSLDFGGSIEVFPDVQAAKERSDFIQQSIKAMGGILTREYHYLNGGVLVRVSGLLTPDQAKVYEEALRATSR